MGSQEPQSVERIGMYAVYEPIGEGAASVVYRAHAPDGTEVALKVIRPPLLVDDRIRARVRREIGVLREIDHPNVVPLLDSGEDDGRLYLVFPRPAGSETLEDRLEHEGPLRQDEVVALASQLAAALEAVHAAGLVHRDVKPANVMLAGGRAQLGDFGLVGGRRFTTVTASGQALGTADYMAPELIRGEEATAASDLYSLACTLYACVCGCPPFSGRSLLATGLAHLEDDPPDPCSVSPEVSATFAAALTSALAKTAAARPPSPSAYAALLEAAHAQAVDSSSAPVRPATSDDG